MDFTESAEHEMLRAAVGDIAAGFGHEYFREQARTGGAPTSCGRRSPSPASCRCTCPRSTAVAAAG